MPHEHSFHRLQVELGREIHDGKILVVEFAMLLSRVAVSLHEMHEKIAMRLDMPIEVHGHEAVQLEEPRIHVTHEPSVWEWHLGDDVSSEPLGSAFFSEPVHHGRIYPGTDRT